MSNIYAGISMHLFSKHHPTFISIPMKNEIKKLPKYVQIIKNDDTNFQNFKNELGNINWNQIISTDYANNPCENYNRFSEKVLELKNKHMPTKTVKFNRYKDKIAPWMTNGILNCIKQKDNLYKKLLCLPKTNENYNTIKLHYKNYESNLKNLISTMKKNYFRRQFDKFKGDIKNTWVTIKSILNKNNTSGIKQTKFLVNGQFIQGDLKIANAFNEFFTKIGPSLADNIELPVQPKLFTIF